MTVEIRLASSEQRYIIQNMWPAYIHDLSQYRNQLPNKHGLFDDDEISTYTAENFMTGWWTHPKQAFAFILYVEERAAGFALVASPPLVDGKADKVIAEFFLLHPYRGKGIGKLLATQVFDMFKGSWQVSVLPKSKPALAFWRKVISEYTNDKFHEQEQKYPDELMIDFFFSSF